MNNFIVVVPANDAFARRQWAIAKEGWCYDLEISQDLNDGRFLSKAINQTARKEK